MAPLADDEWAELVAEELPKTSDPVIQKYLESRRALVAEEQKHRSDYTFRQALSPIARKACDIVSRINDEERRVAEFTASRETTKSWQIMRRLPKGALLGGHCHSLIDVDHLVDAALSTPGLHIACDEGHLATTDVRRERGLRIQFEARADPDTNSVWTDAYVPGTFIPLDKAADDYPEGGKQGFVEWLKGRCRTFTQDPNIRDTPTASSVCSETIDGMLYYEPLWRASLRRLMANLVDDGVYWLELRLTFPLAYYREGSEAPDQDYDHMFQVIKEELASFQAADPRRQFWGIRVVWSAIRSQDSRSIIEDADNCVATKLIWPDFLAGYDLGGSGGSSDRPLADQLPELFWLRKQCALEGVQIPFFYFFDAGAFPGDATTADTDLFDALLLGTRRIGNAATLHRHPRLVAAVRDKRILVEISPADDTVMRDSLPALLAQGVPCALCHDTPFGQAQELGLMTRALWKALHAWDGVDLATLGSLAENSVRWAAFEDQDAESWSRDIRAASVGAGVKAARLQQWAVEWERFCLWVVTEYGDAYGGGDDGDEGATTGVE